MCQSSFRDFLWDIYKVEYPESNEDLTKLLQNMNLTTDAGVLNLAGVLLFAERPEWIKPQFVVKALVHRDYLVSAPIRLFIFDNRIEIVSPGHLPNNLRLRRSRLVTPISATLFWSPMLPRECCHTDIMASVLELHEP
jgi:predicted HTH transcriptional regulator